MLRTGEFCSVPTSCWRFSLKVRGPLLAKHHRRSQQCPATDISTQRQTGKKKTALEIWPKRERHCWLTDTICTASHNIGPQCGTVSRDTAFLEYLKWRPDIIFGTMDHKNSGCLHVVVLVFPSSFWRHRDVKLLGQPFSDLSMKQSDCDRMYQSKVDSFSDKCTTCQTRACYQASQKQYQIFLCSHVTILTNGPWADRPTGENLDCLCHSRYFFIHTVSTIESGLEMFSCCAAAQIP